MKKIAGLLCVVVMMFVVLPADAQLRVGVKGGVNISTVHLDDLPNSLNPDNVTGFHIGPMIEGTVPLLGIGFDAAILFNQKGMEIGDADIKIDYLDIPLHLKWKFGLPFLKVYLATGPYFGFRLGGDKVWKVLTEQIEAKTFGAGWDFGAGVEVINHLQIGFNYGLGLTDNYSIGSKSDGKNRGWMISATILF